VHDVEDTVVHEHTAQDGPLGLEAPQSEVRHPSRSPGPELEAVTLTGPTLSWFGATTLLREKLQTLKGRTKQGPLKHGEVLEIERLTAGQEAFDKLLPKLRSAQFLDLKDLPRTPRGSKELGRFNFYPLSRELLQRPWKMPLNGSAIGIPRTGRFENGWSLRGKDHRTGWLLPHQ
jgi:hypothetical protein